MIYGIGSRLHFVVFMPGQKLCPISGNVIEVFNDPAGAPTYRIETVFGIYQVEGVNVRDSLGGATHEAHCYNRRFFKDDQIIHS